MIKYFCDRCKKETPREQFHKEIAIVDLSEKDNPKRIRSLGFVCDKCVEEFEKFVNGGLK